MPKRAYETSHPWIVFKPNLSKSRTKLWMLLGAAQSKCRHLAKVILLPELANEMHQVYLAKGALATTAIEGNTLREDEVEAYLKGELELPPSREYLEQEIQNIVDACNKIGEKILVSQDFSLCSEEIREYNKDVLRNLKVEEGVIPGEYRTHSVEVGKYRGAPAEDCPYLMNCLVSMLQEITDPEHPALGKGFEIASGILASILAHLYIAWIHPFGDGNGRTARLLEFRFLLEAGAPTPAAHLLSNHYDKTRSEYYIKLHESSKRDDGISQFLEYALQGFIDGLDEQIDLVQEQQRKILWRYLVDQSFAKDTGSTAIRKKGLVFALTDAKEPVEIDLMEIRRLSPELSDEYANKTKKTLTRDIKNLLEQHLIVKEGNKIKANTDRVLALLPLRRI
ncbi:MAG TPA: Fic family protein [Synergistaceae bacterium]|nr:Fic family protein [Synergistaceae bacterium]